MNSLDIISFKKNIEDYCQNSGLPYEVIRMVFRELLETMSKKAYEEAYAQTLQATKEAESEAENVKSET